MSTEECIFEIYTETDKIPSILSLVKFPLKRGYDNYSEIVEQLVASYIDTGKVIL